MNIRNHTESADAAHACAVVTSSFELVYGYCGYALVLLECYCCSRRCLLPKTKIQETKRTILMQSMKQIFHAEDVLSKRLTLKLPSGAGVHTK